MGDLSKYIIINVNYLMLIKNNDVIVSSLGNNYSIALKNHDLIRFGNIVTRIQ